MLKLGILMHKGSRVIIVLVQVGAVKIYASSSAGAREKKETQDETQSTTKNWWKKKLVWVPVISFCKIFIPSYTFDALFFCPNWPFWPH
jgi:hypothetical protein